MTDALSRALAASQRSLLACKAAVSTSSEAMLARSPGGVPVTRTDLSIASEQLRHFSGWVYSAIRPIATRIAGCPIHVGKSKSPGKLITKAADIKPLDDHEVLRLFANPNDLMVSWSLMFATIASLELTGRQLWWIPGKKDQRKVWPIPTSWIRDFQGTTRFTSFKVQPPGVPEGMDIDADECCLFVYPSPSDPWGATSPLMACGAAVDADESIISSQISMFRRGIHPSHAVIVGSQAHPDFPGSNGRGSGGFRPRLSDTQHRQVIEAICRRYAGTFHHGEPLILDGLIEDVKVLSNTAKEMDYLQSGAFTKERIYQGFGVSPIIAGQIEGSNRASSDAADRHFVSFNIAPKCQLLSETMTGWLRVVFGDESLCVWIEAPQPDDAEFSYKWASLLAQYSAITGDELRERSPLGLQAGGFDQPVTPGKTQAEQSMDDATIALGKAVDEISPSRQAEKLLAEIGGDRHQSNGRHWP